MNSRFLASCAASVIVVAVPTTAQADEIHHFNLPRQSLASSLLAAGRTVHVSIAFEPALVRGHDAPAVRGSYSVEQVISSLLKETGLTVRRVNARSYLIVADTTKARLAQASMNVARIDAPSVAARPTTSPPPADTMELQEIVVTAQKREESLQRTPISIAVLGAKELEDRGISNLADFGSGAVPSLRIVPSNGGRPSSMFITMRGIGPGESAQISFDATVGLYLDGVYLGRAQGLGSELFDLRRIEVLRGPQGTLFGRNAVGGAISMVSKRPTGELGLDLKAGVRNFDGQDVSAHINLPEFAGFSVKLDGVWSKRGGWVENPEPGQKDWHAWNRHGVRASVLWEPASNLNLLYSFDTSRDATVAGYGQIAALRPSAPALPPIFSVEPDRVRKGRAGALVEPNIGKVSGHSLNVNWDITEHLTLRSISAYRKLSQTQYDNYAALLQPYSPNGLFARLSYGEVNQDQYSQEFQIIGNFDQMKFVMGAFYYKENADDFLYSPFTAQFNNTGTDFSYLPFTLGPGGARFPDRASKVHSRSKAVFGQATYTPSILDDRLHLTAGLRWTDDHKSGSLNKLRGATVHIPFDFNSERVDPAFSADFDVTAVINTYVRWGRAYRAGGANARSSTFRPFGEEQVSSWEVGAKTELFDRRVRLNAAAFHTRYSDRQVGFVNPANPSNVETLNTPDPTTIKGAEFDLTARLAQGLTLTSSYAFTDYEAARDTNPFTGIVQQGAVSYTPRHAASAALDHQFEPFAGATLSTHVDVIYSSSFYTASATSPKTGSYAILNGRVTLGDIAVGESGAKASISLWGKNITNTQWQISRFNLEGPGLANYELSYFNEPRTYGLEARLTF